MIICSSFRFDSAHYLPHYKGKCKNLHGHSFKVDVAVHGTELKNGILLDFKELKEKVNTITDSFDHQCLNNFFENPTAEILAKHFYHLIPSVLPDNVYIKFVRVWESDTCYAQVGE